MYSPSLPSRYVDGVFQYTAVEDAILKLLANDRGGLTQVTLSRLLDVNRTTMWHNLCRLVERGELTYEWLLPESHDGRPVRVYRLPA